MSLTLHKQICITWNSLEKNVYQKIAWFSPRPILFFFTDRVAPVDLPQLIAVSALGPTNPIFFSETGGVEIQFSSYQVYQV